MASLGHRRLVDVESQVHRLEVGVVDDRDDHVSHRMTETDDALRCGIVVASNA